MLPGRIAFVSISNADTYPVQSNAYCVRCRTIQGIDETDKYVVKLYGALLSPLDGKGEEQRLILVMERRATTLPEALRRGLSRDERKQIAFDIGNALSFLHEKSLIHENLTADCVLVSQSDRAIIEFSMRVRFFHIA